MPPDLYGSIADAELYFVELAKNAYDAYGSVTDHKNYQGLPMPEWNALPDKIRSAWIASAKFVFHQTLTDRPC